MVAKIFEVAMLVMFGISWPINLAKSIKTKSTKGKSLIFLILIDVGYIFGMMSKIFSTTFVWPTDWWVFAIYVVNFCFVSADLTVYFINRNREKKELQTN